VHIQRQDLHSPKIYAESEVEKKHRTSAAQDQPVDQKYTQKVKWKRSTELLRPKISRLTEKMTLLGLTMGEQQSAIDLLWSNLKPGVAVHKPGTRSAH
jgi:hypothetical protein